MKSSTKQGIVAVIIVALLVAYFANFFGPYGFPSPLRSTDSGGKGPPITWTDSQVEKYKRGVGVFSAQMDCYNSLAPTTALTHATNFDLLWYTKRGTSWVYHGTGDNINIDMTPEDNGILYIVVQIKTSQNYYVDYQKIEEMNSYVTGHTFEDVDGDTKREFVFSYDMRDHSIPGSGYPEITFHCHCYAYDNSFTGLNNLADLTSVGATTTTKFQEWYLSFATAQAQSAVALQKIEYKVTQTDESKVVLKQLKVPGRGYLHASNFVYAKTASYYTWTYTYSDTFDGAYYLEYPLNALNKFETTARIEPTLGATNVTTTLTVYYFTAQTMVPTSTTDDCELQI